jgi:hypothetical protein
MAYKSAVRITKKFLDRCFAPIISQQSHQRIFRSKLSFHHFFQIFTKYELAIEFYDLVDLPGISSATHIF